MSTFRKHLEKSLLTITDASSVEIGMPDPTRGDYTTNIALELAQKLKTDPMRLAQDIASQLLNKFAINSEAVEPGFINVKIPLDFYSTLLSNLLIDVEKTEMIGRSHKGKTVVVEYTDPNPFKEFHIGHLYSNSVGEAISRLLESQGARVFRLCYQGDVGVHVAKAIFGMMKLKSQMPDENDGLSEKAKFLGKAYAEGDKAYESESSKKEIDELNKKIYEKDKEVLPLYEKGKKWSLQYFNYLYKKLGTKFDKLYFESEAGEQGLKIVKQNTPKVFKEDQGAIIFKGEDYRLHTRVFVNSQDLPTYEAKELGLAPLKYKDFPYDLSIIITGNEINEYFKVLLKALSLIKPDLASKTVHISHGMVRLTSGKMSSRTGDVVTAEQVLNDIESKLKEKFDVSSKNLEAISVGSAKYALLKSGVGKDIVFSIEESISINGNSGPYIQYTYARTQSVLAKSKIKNKISNLKFNLDNLEKEERELLRKLAYFEDYAEMASKNYSPNTICTYLFELASSFNLFYEKHKIIGSKDQEFRLALTLGTGKILKKGLHLLGIEAPARM